MAASPSVDLCPADNHSIYIPEHVPLCLRQNFTERWGFHGYGLIVAPPCTLFAGFGALRPPDGCAGLILAYARPAIIGPNASASAAILEEKRKKKADVSRRL